MGLSFLKGLVAAVNPCAFVLLPTYLAYFLGSEAGLSTNRVQVTTKDSLGTVFFTASATSGTCPSGVSCSRSAVPIMIDAGVRALTIEAGKAVVFDRDEMIRLADASGIAIHAFEEGDFGADR